MRGRRSFARYEPTRADNLAQMKRFLCCITEKNLEALTLDGLLKMFRVEPKVAEYELTIAKQNLARREAMNRPI